MRIVLNGTPTTLTAPSTVADLLARERGDLTQGVAVAVNAEVVRRHDWSTHRLRAGDDVEIVTAVQGG